MLAPPESPESADPFPAPNRLQFSLYSLFGFTTACAVLFWLVQWIGLEGFVKIIQLVLFVGIGGSVVVTVATVITVFLYKSMLAMVDFVLRPLFLR